ncbi:MAG: hypothetical protein HUJ25_00360 [Crocinitomicaceae bacterium]|nr:hypothetical protein [Crocinitomicaceae bacterium]
MKKILARIFILLALTSCVKDKAIAPNPNDNCLPTSYLYNVRPIIESSCKTQEGPGTGCHDAWIDSYSAIKATIDNGTFQNEVFIEKTMPEIPNIWGIDSLTESEVKTLDCWINQGYPEN